VRNQRERFDQKIVVVNFDLVRPPPDEQRPEQRSVSPPSLCGEESQAVALHGPYNRLQFSYRLHARQSRPMSALAQSYPRSIAWIALRGFLRGDSEG
jgi:hypothetical protein